MASHAYISGRSATLEISFQRPEAFIVDSNVAALTAEDSGVAAIMAELSDSDLTMNAGNFTAYIQGYRLTRHTRPQSGSNNGS